MLEDRRLSFAVESHQLYVKPQLRRAKANQFLKELEGLLLREPIEEPDESDLIGKAEPVMRAPTVAELEGWLEVVDELTRLVGFGAARSVP